MLSLIFWLQEIDETKSRQCRAISFLDRDPLRDEVQLTQIVQNLQLELLLRQV